MTDNESPSRVQPSHQTRNDINNINNPQSNSGSMSSPIHINQNEFQSDNETADAFRSSTRASLPQESQNLSKKQRTKQRIVNTDNLNTPPYSSSVPKQSNTALVDDRTGEIQDENQPIPGSKLSPKGRQVMEEQYSSLSLIRNILNFDKEIEKYFKPRRIPPGQNKIDNTAHPSIQLHSNSTTGLKTQTDDNISFVDNINTDFNLTDNDNTNLANNQLNPSIDQTLTPSSTFSDHTMNAITPDITPNQDNNNNNNNNNNNIPAPTLTKPAFALHSHDNSINNHNRPDSLPSVPKSFLENEDPFHIKKSNRNVKSTIPPKTSPNQSNFTPIDDVIKHPSQGLTGEQIKTVGLGVRFDEDIDIDPYFGLGTGDVEISNNVVKKSTSDSTSLKNLYKWKEENKMAHKQGTLFGEARNSFIDPIEANKKQDRIDRAKAEMSLGADYDYYDSSDYLKRVKSAASSFPTDGLDREQIFIKPLSNKDKETKTTPKDIPSYDKSASVKKPSQQTRRGFGSSSSGDPIDDEKT